MLTRARTYACVCVYAHKGGERKTKREACTLWFVFSVLYTSLNIVAAATVVISSHGGEALQKVPQHHLL